VIKGAMVVFEKYFNDGDILHSICGENILLIFKNCESDGEFFNSHYNQSMTLNSGWRIDGFRHATEEEKQLLFDKMKEQGLRWNAEEKRVEEIRWRAKEGEGYYHLDALFTVQYRIYKDCFSDREMVKKYNHFRTKDLAKEAAEVVKEALRKFHEENK
jgi:hypothetical protein